MLSGLRWRRLQPVLSQHESLRHRLWRQLHIAVPGREFLLAVVRLGLRVGVLEHPELRGALRRQLPFQLSRLGPVLG